VGVLGFPAGRARPAGTLATSAFAATHFSAAGGALTWALVEWWRKGKPSVLGAAAGMVAGLAAITPASGFVTAPVGFSIGALAGISCYFAVTRLKARFRYDDALDVFGVHGVGSVIGMVMVGLFADPAINPAIGSTYRAHGVVQSLAGGAGQLLNQLIGVAFTVVFAGVGSYVLYKIVDKLLGMRVDEEDEYTGLDITQHGESAYSE
jgi:Amt family ammonium transporter